MSLRDRIIQHFNWRGVRAAVLVPRLVCSLPLTSDVRAKLLNLVGCQIGERARIETGAVVIGRNLRMGPGSYLNTGVFVDALNAPVTIGRDVLIGPRAVILTDTHVPGPASQRAGANESRPVTIEDGTWIGASATILPGVTVSSGCIIGAGAVVTRDTLPNGRYVGIPAVRTAELS